MTDRFTEQLEACKSQLERQDEAWEHAMATLARIGEPLRVPRETLDAVEAVTSVPCLPAMGVRA